MLGGASTHSPTRQGSNYQSSAVCKGETMAQLDRDGVRIHYEVHGQGPVILLSHGYSATGQMWRGQIDAVSREHTLVTWDMRGHGRSDSPDDPAAYSADATVADMAAILDAVGA